MWDGRSPQPLSQALFIWKTQNSFSHVMIPFVSGNISFNFGASNISGQFCLSAYVSFLYNPDLEVLHMGNGRSLLPQCQTSLISEGLLTPFTHNKICWLLGTSLLTLELLNISFKPPVVKSRQANLCQCVRSSNQCPCIPSFNEYKAIPTVCQLLQYFDCKTSD